MEIEHPNAALVRDLYDARTRNDLEAVRSMLSERGTTGATSSVPEG